MNLKEPFVKQRWWYVSKSEKETAPKFDSCSILLKLYREFLCYTLEDELRDQKSKGEYSESLKENMELIATHVWWIS
ncbi:MAG: hypothetical protein CM15mV74_030 [uncultured marine virus]|nr:MAG: hypothetical protein CM15mV74_030 [uncultured marine virus]